MLDKINSDIFFLKETFKLAKNGEGWTSPNPMVGAVIVKDGHIIAKGYHKQVGFPHAEIEAFRSAKTAVSDTTLYVNLEPCSHYGRTPPCVDVIIKSGIKRVVCSTLDPNPRVENGQGTILLKKAGIEVSVGLLEDEARALNQAFFTFHEKKRPFIAIKFAASLDGKIATRTGDSKWITNDQAREFARIIRSQYQAVLVGINTIIHDNPYLGVRIKGKRDPIRIILDSKLKIPLESQVLRDANVLIATVSSNKEKIKELDKRRIDVISFNETKIPVSVLLQEFKKREIISILVEGGGKTIGRFVDERLVDRVYAFHAPILIGGDKAINAVAGIGVTYIHQAIRLKNITHKRLGNNFLTIGDIE